MKLIVIIPAYNEAQTIGHVIRSIPAEVMGFDVVDVLVIDDGSEDATADIATRAGAKVFSHHKNKGLGAAFGAGIGRALDSGADVIVNIDGDMQFDAQEIPKLVNPILRENIHMVSGSRFLDPRSRAAVPFLRRIGNRGFTALVNRILGTSFTDTQCGFRAYSREAALRLNLFGGFTYTQEAFIDLAYKGMRIAEVPVSVRYDAHRKAKISSSLFVYFWRAIAIIFRTFRDREPLKFFGAPGLFIFVLGFVADLISLIYWLETRTTTPIRMLFFTGTAMLGFGFTLIIFAFLADMLRRMRHTQEEILYKLKK